MPISRSRRFGLRASTESIPGSVQKDANCTITSARPAARRLAGRSICVQFSLVSRLGVSTTGISRLPWRRSGRDFITLLGGAVAWPLAARGQESGRIYRLGCLVASPRDAPHQVALFDELRRLGFIEGQNLVVDSAGYGMSAERFAGHAADVVKARVDVILAGGDAAVRAAQQATTSIPILALTDDMVGQGFVRSLGQPGGNTTGVTLLASELDGKRQEILMEAARGSPDCRACR